jgi:large subunit ribosomal protein L21e
MRRSRGFRSRTRQKLKGGRFSIAEALQTFAIGARVRLHLNPAVHSGMPHPRYQGRLGEVLESRGRSFVVGVKDGSLLKQFTCRPEHLKPEKTQKKSAPAKKVEAKTPVKKAVKAVKKEE